MRTALAAALVLGLSCANWLSEPGPSSDEQPFVYRTDPVRALLAHDAGPAPPESRGRP